MRNIFRNMCIHKTWVCNIKLQCNMKISFLPHSILQTYYHQNCVWIGFSFDNDVDIFFEYHHTLVFLPMLRNDQHLTTRNSSNDDIGQYTSNTVYHIYKICRTTLNNIYHFPQSNCIYNELLTFGYLLCIIM